MVGIIDSGMGGLTTLATLIKYQVDRTFCYYADTANAPYGAKSKVAVMQMVKTAADHLVERGAQQIVLACNTATLVAENYLRQAFAIPIIGVKPPIEDALRTQGSVLLLGTKLTCRHFRDTDYFRVRALPELATLIDRYYPDVDRIAPYCRHALEGIAHVDTLVLGCTHYVLVKDLLRDITGATRLLEGNDATAAQMRRVSGGEGVCVDILASGKIDAARYTRVLQAALRK